MCHCWYLYDSLETFILEDVLHTYSLVQPEAFSETSGLATILPGDATEGLYFPFTGRRRGGEEKKKPHTTKLSYYGLMFTKYFAGKTNKQTKTLQPE